MKRYLVFSLITSMERRNMAEISPTLKWERVMMEGGHDDDGDGPRASAPVAP